MGTTKSAVSQLESISGHSPSLATIAQLAHAVGYGVEIRLVPDNRTAKKLKRKIFFGAILPQCLMERDGIRGRALEDTLHESVPGPAV